MQLTGQQEEEEQQPQPLQQSVLFQLLHHENQLWHAIMMKLVELQQTVLSLLETELINPNHEHPETRTACITRLLIEWQHSEERQYLMLQQKHEQLQFLQEHQLTESAERDQLILLMDMHRREQHWLQRWHLEELNTHVQLHGHS